MSTAQDAISEYKKDFANDPARAGLNLKLRDEIKYNDIARRREIKTLCDFLREGSIRQAPQVTIRLVNNNIGNDEAMELFDAMRGLPVSILQIEGQDMNVDSIEALGEVINSKMHWLDLSRSSFTGDGSAKLGILLPSLQGISSLDLHNTNFDSSGAQGLSEWITTNHNLYLQLDLRNSKFGNGIKDLWPVISSSPNLSVSLENSGIDSEGIIGMADAILSTDRKLFNLGLSGNQVGDEGCGEIARIIARNRLSSSELDLSNMGIGDIGVNAIADAFASNQNITKLNLSSNSKITNEGFLGAIEKFKQNAFLTEVDLSCVPYAEDSARKEIKGVCSRNAAIKDAVSDYSKSVLAPRLVRASCKEESGEIILSDKVIESLNQITQKLLFENLTSEQILEFSANWHTPLNQVKSNGSRNFGKGDWSLLFGEDKKEIDVTLEGLEGWSLVTRNSPEELKKEGSDLNHCVGTYVGKCFKGSSHIVSVVNPEGNSVSTIEIETDYLNRSFRKIQHMGKNNDSISQESQRAEDWLGKEIEEGRISINYDSLHTSKQARKEEAAAKIGGQAKMVIGFNPLDSKKVKDVRKVFKEMLPEGNEQLKKNFSSLVSLEEIQIAGKKYNLSALQKSTKADLTQEEKDKKFSDEMAAIFNKIQKSLNVIFGQGALQASISFPPEGEKTEENRFGQVVLKGGNLLEGDLLDKIKDIFDGEVSDDGYVINSKITPKKVMTGLKNYLTNSQVKPSGRVSPVSEEKLAGEEQDLGRGG